MTDQMREAPLAAISMGRFALPEKIAEACLFLVSDMSNYITGTVLDINGGLHIH